MSDKPSERIVLGEGERAGLPISARLLKEAPAGLYKVRWRHCGTHFVLEFFDMMAREWVEVPCQDMPNDDKNLKG